MTSEWRRVGKPHLFVQINNNVLDKIERIAPKQGPKDQRWRSQHG
jgi:hypothetical protein